MSLGPATDVLEYTVFSSPINIYTVKNAPARKITAVTGDGSVSVKLSGSGGVARTLTLNAGDFEVGEFTSIESASGITRVRVAW
jgi:hypothetical protein